MDTSDSRVPVTLLTGFLGAGKTTLLNRLVADPGAGRVAVVMNELGEIGLDHDLIEQATDETLLLRSGCLCCSIRGDLARTLTSLMARRMRGLLRFDRVVIETTGIAEPGPILQTLVLDEIVARHYRLDGVVTVADAVTGPRTLDLQPEAVSQVAMADLIVLSKTELVTPSALGRFEARLAALNGTAPRLRAAHGRVPSGSLFGLAVPGRPAPEPEPRTEPGPLANLSGLSQPAGTATLPRPVPRGAPHHAGRIGTASIVVEAPIPAALLDAWIEALIALSGPDVLRIKGIAHVEGVARPVVFHGVQHVFDGPVPLDAWSGADRTSRIIVIARHMNESGIPARLEALRRDAVEATAGPLRRETDTPR